MPLLKPEAAGRILPLTMAAPHPQRLPLPTVLRSALLGYCPNCLLGKMFRGFLRPVSSCDICGMPFERDGGTWTATAFLMYLLICTALAAEGLALGLLFGIFPGFMAVLGISAVLLLLLLYRPVRGLWVWCLWKSGFLG